MSTDDVEPLAVPMVALTRLRVEGPLDVRNITDIEPDVCDVPDVFPVW